MWQLSKIDYHWCMTKTKDGAIAIRRAHWWEKLWNYHKIAIDKILYPIIIKETLEPNNLSGSEAIYGFCGWLTMRGERTVMSASDDTAPIADLIKRFCGKNKLPEPREDWAKNLTHPRVIKILE